MGTIQEHSGTLLGQMGTILEDSGTLPLHLRTLIDHLGTLTGSFEDPTVQLSVPADSERSVQCAVQFNALQYNMQCSVQCAVCSVQCAVCSVQCDFVDNC